jgi:hypothetical protein
MNSNITYYDWVPFFKAICHKIYSYIEGGDPAVILRSKIVGLFEATHPLITYNFSDPFSLIYALAQQNTKNKKSKMFTLAKDVFEIDVNIPTDWIFPTPIPIAKASFGSEEGYVDINGNSVGSDCIWSLFKAAHKNENINPDDFANVLKLKNVKTTKLTQVLFLINPEKFIPFDTQMNSLPVPDLADLKQVVSKIDQVGISIYLEAIEKLKSSFAGCELYEINLLNVLINSPYQDQLKVSHNYCQVSSWAQGQQAETDFFNDFVKQNGVWTGGATSESGKTEYPLQDFIKGDIVLVRKGTKNLGGIGIITENGYKAGGWSEDSMIKIVWLVKKTGWTDDALGQRVGFARATEKTLNTFRKAYPDTFTFLDSIRTIQKVMINHSQQKYKNLILQGPPGTGKTRLAKQIAEWLTSDEEKQHSLIEAIDKRIFQEDPEDEANEQIKLIQFHPSYTYEDFVRGIKVDAGEDGIKYDVENRILVSFAWEAAKPENQHKAYVLIIDEINRANLTSVLGELIYALEYRGKNVSSLYKLKDGDNEIMLPHNLYIIGTMNTADRSVSHIDYAIRRRFTFIPVPSNDSAITHNRAKSLFAAVKQIFDEHTSPEFDQNDIQIGHSYFLVNDDEIAMKLKYEIKPLLLEYIKDGVLLESAREKVKGLNA